MERQTAVINIFKFFGKEVDEIKKHILPVLENNLPLLEGWFSYEHGAFSRQFETLKEVKGSRVKYNLLHM